MRETPKRVIGVLLALGLIVVFVIGAVELATDQDAKPPAPVAETNQTSEAQSAAPAPAGPSEAAPSTALSVSAAPSGADLPSTGPGDFIVVSLSLSAIALVSSSYWRSRHELRRWQLNRG